MLEARQYFDLAQRPLAVCLVLERGYLLDGHFGFRLIVCCRSAKERWESDEQAVQKVPL